MIKMWYHHYNNHKVYIDTCREEYSEAIITLERDSFSDPYDSMDKLFPDTLREYIIIMYIFSQENSIGFLRGLLTRPSVNIDRFAINKLHQHKGFGRLLLYFFLGYSLFNHKIELVQLEVNSRNFSGISLYKKAGFNITGIRKDYYGDGQDGLLMDLTIKEHIELINVEYKKWKKERA